MVMGKCLKDQPITREACRTSATSKLLLATVSYCSGKLLYAPIYSCAYKAQRCNSCAVGLKLDDWLSLLPVFLQQATSPFAPSAQLTGCVLERGCRAREVQAELCIVQSQVMLL